MQGTYNELLKHSDVRRIWVDGTMERINKIFANQKVPSSTVSKLADLLSCYPLEDGVSVIKTVNVPKGKEIIYSEKLKNNGELIISWGNNTRSKRNLYLLGITIK